MKYIKHKGRPTLYQLGVGEPETAGSGGGGGKKRLEIKRRGVARNWGNNSRV